MERHAVTEAAPRPQSCMKQPRTMQQGRASGKLSLLLLRGTSKSRAQGSAVQDFSARSEDFKKSQLG